MLMLNMKKIIENIKRYISRAKNNLINTPLVSSSSLDHLENTQSQNQPPHHSLIYRIINGSLGEFISFLMHTILVAIPQIIRFFMDAWLTFLSFILPNVLRKTKTEDNQSSGASPQNEPAADAIAVFAHGLRGDKENFNLIVKSIGANYKKEELAIHAVEFAEDKDLTHDAILLKKQLQLLSNSYNKIYLVGHSRGSRVAKAAYEMLKAEKDETTCNKIHTIHLISSPEGTVEVVKLTDYFLKVFGKNKFTGYPVRLALRWLIEDYFKIKESYTYFTKYPKHVGILRFKIAPITTPAENQSLRESKEASSPNLKQAASPSSELKATTTTWKAIISVYDIVVGNAKHQRPSGEIISETHVHTGHMNILNHPTTIKELLGGIQDMLASAKASSESLVREPEHGSMGSETDAEDSVHSPHNTK